MPRYEFKKGTSSKFWEIELAGKSFTTTYGRLGAAGQSTTKKFGSPADAAREHDKLVKEKVGKGYKLVSGKAKPAKGAPKPTGKGDAKAARKAAAANLAARTVDALALLELGPEDYEARPAKPAGKRAPELPEDWEDGESLDVGALRSYLAKGGDPNVSSTSDVTPLMIAARGGQIPAVKMLLDAGADVNACDYKEATPLHMAADAGAADVVALLLAHKADPRAVNVNNDTPLHKAPEINARDRRSQSARVRIVEMLLDAGAAVDAISKTRRTPLVEAAHCGDLPVLQALLARGASPNPKHWEVAEIAAEDGYKDVARALRAAGAGR